MISTFASLHLAGLLKYSSGPYIYKMQLSQYLIAILYCHIQNAVNRYEHKIYLSL